MTMMQTMTEHYRVLQICKKKTYGIINIKAISDTLAFHLLEKSFLDTGSSQTPAKSKQSKKEPQVLLGIIHYLSRFSLGTADYVTHYAD